MKVIFQQTEKEFFPSACPDIEVRLSESIPHVQFLIGVDLFYLTPDAAITLAWMLEQAAGQIKLRGTNAPKS